MNTSSGKERSSSKKRFRLNFVDIILLLIIAAAAAILVYILASGTVSGRASDRSVKLEYKVLISGIRKEFANNIQPGDSVTDTVKLMPIGRIKSAVPSDYMSPTEDPRDGSIKHLKFPDYIDIMVTVNADGMLKNGFYMIGGYEISVGTLVSLRTPNFTGQGYCTEIYEASDSGAAPRDAGDNVEVSEND